MMTCRTKPDSCSGCVLLPAGTDFSQPEGTARLGVMICGEANGEMEARDQLPFRSYAPAGAVLTRTIKRLGMDRSDFLISNLLRCRPWENALEGTSYEHQSIEHCRSNFLALLRQYRPKVILACGNLPLKHLTGMSGEHCGVGHLRGYVLRALPVYCEAAQNPDLVVVPSFHPSHLRQGAIHLTGVLARDIARAVNIAAGKDKNYILDLPNLALSAADCPYDPVSNPDVWDANYADWAQRRKQEIHSDLAAFLARHNLRYQCWPTRREIDAFCRDVKARSDAWLALTPDAREASYLALSHDIETYESASLDEDATDGFTDTQVKLSQFSIEVGQGIALTWDKDGIAATRWLLKLPLPKCGHNHWLFDTKVLRAVGQRDFNDVDYFMPVGTMHDTLQQFHFFQADLPAHLQFASSFVQFPYPWKHYNNDCLEFYGCVDTDAALRVYQMTRRTMEDRGTWKDSVAGRHSAGYVNQVEAVRPILAKMEERGLPVNDERRLALGVEFVAAEKESRAELNSRFPDEARKIKSYKTVPQPVKEILEEITPTCLPAADAVRENGKPLTKAARTKLEKAAKEVRWAGVTVDEMAVIRARRFQESPTKNDDGEIEEGEWYFFDRRWLTPEGKKAEEDDPEAKWVWCRVYDFSPNSSPQLLAYMRAKRHKVPFDKKRGSETTSKKELTRLTARFHDNFYLKVIECRELRKMKSTYIDGFRPHADGRVHTTFTFATAIGQLSSRNPNCFSADTEILTLRGWVPFPELRLGDQVAEWRWDGASARVRFSAPQDFICNLHYAPLKHIHTEEQIDLLVTADHDCHLIERKHKQLRIFKAESYPSDYIQIQAGVYEGCSVSLSEAQVALICALQADGHVMRGRIDSRGRHRGNGGHYTFTFAKKRKIDRFWWAVMQCSIPFSRREEKNKKKPRTTFYISRKDIPAWWTDKKFFGEWLLQFDRNTLDLFSEEIWKWDGCASRRSSYASSVKSNTDWAQIITILSGRRAKIRLYPGMGERKDNWQLDVATNAYSMTTNAVMEDVPHVSGVYVYCVTMPWGTVIVRRNGKVAFTGNCQNFGKHGRLAKATRQMIAAEPGMLLSEWDFKSCHVLTLGYLANDPAYIRLARIDMHSIMTGHFLKLWRVQDILCESDEELKARCKWLKSNETYKKMRDEKIKHAGLGIGNGLKAKGLYERYMEFFSSPKESAAILGAYEEVYPKVFAWQNRTQWLAHNQNFLLTEFGYMRHYYEVFRWDSKRNDWGHGDQGEEAISFWLSNIAFGHIREKMKELDAAGLADRYGLCNNVHDSFLFHFDERLLDEHLERVRPILESPSKVLIGPAAPEGLWIGVDCAVGKNWGEMKEMEAKKAAGTVTVEATQESSKDLLPCL